MVELTVASVTSRRDEMPNGERFRELMTMSEVELLSEFLSILLRPGVELTAEDHADIQELDHVFKCRRMAARA
jgi:hypothetical protein